MDRDNKEGWSLVKEPIPLGPRVLWEHPHEAPGKKILASVSRKAKRLAGINKRVKR